MNEFPKKYRKLVAGFHSAHDKPLTNPGAAATPGPSTLWELAR